MKGTSTLGVLFAKNKTNLGNKYHASVPNANLAELLALRELLEGVAGEALAAGVQHLGLVHSYPQSGYLTFTSAPI